MSDKTFDTDVLIVGAGPTGLALAVDLARRGVRARLAERGESLFPGSRGKGLQPRTQEVFDDLGVRDGMLKHGGPYPRMQSWEDGRRTREWDMAERTAPRPGEPYHEGWMLPQWRTQELLYTRLRELGGEAEFGTALAGLTQDAHGVTAELSGGSWAGAGTGSGAVRGVRARYLVAADGGRSTVRKALGIGMAGETVDPAPMLVADVRLTGLDTLSWHVWPKAEGGGVAICPLAGTDDFQLAAQYTREGAVPDTSPEAVRALIAARTHLEPGQVRDVMWASDYRARAALADRFRAGRVFLAGDAAHIHSPAGGQGLNTGVQDAYNLGWKLGQALGADTGIDTGTVGANTVGAEADAEALLDSYERERRPVAADVLGLSTRIHRGTAQRGREVRQLDLTYREGPLAFEARTSPGGTLRAGDRAPDAVCVTAQGERIRLFDAFRGPHFTLLAFGGGTYEGECGGPLRAYAVAETEQHAEAAYGTGLFLVRPDGYIGAAAEGPDQLRPLLRAFGLVSGPSLPR